MGAQGTGELYESSEYSGSPPAAFLTQLDHDRSGNSFKKGSEYSLMVPLQLYNHHPP